MKTKLFNLVAIALFALLTINSAQAQLPFRAGQILSEPNFKYICEIPWMEPGANIFVFSNYIRIRSINNRFTGIAQRDENGRLVPAMNAPKSVDSNGNAFKIFHGIINAVLDDTDKRTAGAATLYVFVYVDPATSKIVDVEFQMDAKSDFAKIALAKYHQIETLLKQSVTYHLTPEGRKLNYIHDAWMYRGVWFGQTIR